MQKYQDIGLGRIFMVGNDLVTSPQIISGASDTAAEVYAETEDSLNNPDIGSIYLSSNGLIFQRIAAAGAAADWSAVSSSVAESANIFVSASAGSDTVGNGSSIAPYATIAVAMAAVTSARKNVVVSTGSYTEALAIVWPVITGVSLIGDGDVIINQPTAGDEVIDITPGAQSAAFEATIKNVTINHDTAGLDGIMMDNTAITEDLTLNLVDVDTLGATSDKSLLTVHDDETAAIIVNWTGSGTVNGDVYLDAGNAGDRFIAENILLLAGMETAADATAFVIVLKYCGVLHEGVTGGNAAQTINTVGAYSVTGDTYALVDTNDLAGSQTENIL